MVELRCDNLNGCFISKQPGSGGNPISDFELLLRYTRLHSLLSLYRLAGQVLGNGRRVRAVFSVERRTFMERYGVHSQRHGTTTRGLRRQENSCVRRWRQHGQDRRQQNCVQVQRGEGLLVAPSHHCLPHVQSRPCWRPCLIL